MPQQVVRQQDEDLDKLHQNVKKIGAMGETISEELKTQEKYCSHFFQKAEACRMIDDLDTEVEKTDNRIVGAVRKVNEMIDKASSIFLCCSSFTLFRYQNSYNNSSTGGRTGGTYSSCCLPLKLDFPMLIN